MTEPVITIEEIDMHKAQEILGLNTRNRNIHERTVSRYANDMLAGKWEFTGDAIRINGDGTLIDGQHRLAAVIQASASDPGLTVRTLVIRNLPARTQDFMDIGRKRSVGDQVFMRGMRNSSLVAASSRLILYYETYMKNPEVDFMRIRNSSVLEWIDAHPQIEEFAAQHSSTGSSNMRSNAAVAAAAWVITNTCEDEAAVSTFFAMFVDGIGLEENSPVLALRNRLQVASSRNERILYHNALHLILRAWNAYRRGEEINRFPLRSRTGAPVLVSKVEA